MCPSLACQPVTAARRLPTFPFVMRRDGGPELVIRGKHPVVAMPVLPRRRDGIGEPVEGLKRREFDDTARSRLPGLPPTTPPDSVGGFVPRQHVAAFGDAAVCTTPYEESLEGEGGPAAIPQQVFQTPKIARHVAIVERDPDTRID